MIALTYEQFEYIKNLTIDDEDLYNNEKDLFFAKLRYYIKTLTSDSYIRQIE